MNKKILLVFILAVGAAYFLVHSHYDYLCMKYQTNGAALTVHGVMCWRENSFIQFVSLKGLQIQESQNAALEKCIKENTGREFICDPRYSPPVPTVESSDS